MSWVDYSYKKKGFIIGAGLAMVLFAMFHMPMAIFVDNYFTSDQSMLSEIHIIAIFFVIIVLYCAFMGLAIGKMIDILKKYES